jgi:hypothetical protein
VLTQALDKASGADRNSEQLGLYLHTLVRQGKARQALEAIAAGGKYAYELPAEPAYTAPAASAAAAAAPAADAAPAAAAGKPATATAATELAPAAGAGDKPAKGKAAGAAGGKGKGGKGKGKGAAAAGGAEDDDALLAGAAAEAAAAGGSAEGASAGAGAAAGSGTGASAAGGEDAEGTSLKASSERAAGEDVLESADGSGGRGKAPAPFQPVDTARYTAYLLSQSGHDWPAAAAAYADLLLSHDAEDWAYHTGLAVSVARTTLGQLAAAADATAAAGIVRSRLGAITASGAAAASGVAELDAWLAHALPSAVAAGAAAAGGMASPTPSTPGGSAGARAMSAAGGKGARPSRGATLSVLQLLCARLETAQRIISGAGSSAAPHLAAPPVLSAAKEAFDAAQTQYGQALAAAFVRLGANASATADLRPFLIPLLAALPDALAPFAADPAAGRLDGFVASPQEHPVLPMPWHPAALVGSAADSAPVRPVFRWAFTLAPEHAAGPLLAAIRSVRAADAPTAATAARVEAVVAAAREAALARDKAAAAAAAAAKTAAKSAPKAAGKEAGKGKEKPKAGKKGKGGGTALTIGGDDESDEEADGGAAGVGSAAAARAPLSDDPHGVKDALKPASELLLTAEQEAELAEVRASVRRYITATGVLRYLGLLSLRGHASHPYPVAPALTAFAAAGAGSLDVAVSEEGLRGEVNTLVAAWEATLPLSYVAIGGLREVQEGDDLLLLACSMLVELGYAGAYAPAGLGADPAAAVGGLPAAFAAGFQAAAGAGAGAPGSEADAASAGATWAAGAYTDLPLGALLRCRQYLLEATLLLDVACDLSPYNGGLHMAAVRVHSLTGSTAGVLTRFAALRVKHISRDTLTHLVTPQVSRLAWPDALRSTAVEVTNFHNNERPQGAEYVRAALREGNLSSALDIMRMDRRLAESGSRASARSALGQHLLLSSGRTPAEALAVLRRLVQTRELPDCVVDVSPEALARLRDNDDRGVLPCFDPPSLPLLQEARTGLLRAARGSKAAEGALAAGAAAGAGTALAAARAGNESDPAHALRATADAAAAYTAALLRAANADSAAARAVASGASPRAVLYALAGQLAAGSNGGSYERLLRRVNRDGSLISRNTLLAAVFAAAEGRAEGAGTAIGSWEAAQAAAGLAAAPAAAAGSDAASALAPLTDFTTGGGLLPLADTSFTAERASFRAATAQLLHHGLRAVHAALAAEHSSAATPHAAPGASGHLSAAAHWKAAAEHAAGAREALVALPGQLLPFTHLPVTVTGYVEASAASSDAGAGAGKEREREKPSVRIVAPALNGQSVVAMCGSVSASGKGAKEREKDKDAAAGTGWETHPAAGVDKAGTAAGMRPVNPAMLAETTLFLLHTAPFLCLVAAAAAKSAAAIKAAAAAKGPAKASSEAHANLTLPEAAPAGEALSGFVAELARCCGVLERDLRAVNDLLQLNTERLIPLINGGFQEAFCASAFARGWLPRRKEKAPKRDVALAGLGAGAAYVREALLDREGRIRSRIEMSIVGVGASYANTVAKVHEEARHRLLFLKEAASGKF